MATLNFSKGFVCFLRSGELMIFENREDYNAFLLTPDSKQMSIIWASPDVAFDHIRDADKELQTLKDELTKVREKLQRLKGRITYDPLQYPDLYKIVMGSE